MKIIKSQSYILSKRADAMISPSPNTEFNIVINHKIKGTPEKFYSSPELLDLLKQKERIDIYLLDKTQKMSPKSEFRLNPPYSYYADHELHPIIGDISIQKSLPKTEWDKDAPDEQNIKEEENYNKSKQEGLDQYYYVSGVSAKNKYGPMLYDKAIEVASKLGCKLINNATDYWIKKKPRPGVTLPEAWNVWNKYKERQDVTKHDLGDDFYALSKDPNQKYFYEK